MFLEEEYYLYRLSHQLINEHNFTILQINPHKSEIWLEKKIKGISHVVRMIHRQFDWKNHLQIDMEQLLANIKRTKHLILGRKVIIHNLYIATHQPVDEWESLKKPLKLQDRKLSEMRVYYLDETERTQEQIRFSNHLSLTLGEIDYPSDELELQRLTEYLKSMIIGMFQKSQKEAQDLFRKGKPLITYALLIANIMMFLLLEINGGSTSTATLIEYGAKYNPAIIEGEWWRIITSMFIHIGAIHLFMNMLALYYLGSAVEQIFGNIRFVVIYFLAGIIGGLTSFAMNPQIAAGASGAIFGLFGALLFFGLNYRRVFFQTMGWNVIFVIIINIVFGLSLPQIDNGAHIGGLIGGFIASAVVFFPKKRKLGIQLLSIVVYGLISAGLLIYGSNEETTQLQRAQDLVNEAKYEEVVQVTSGAIDSAKDYKAELLFFRSFAYIKLEQSNKAMTDLEEVLTIKSDFPEAHYNLALLYLDSEDNDKALQQIEKALELDPENEDFNEFYNQLIR